MAVIIIGLGYAFEPFLISFVLAYLFFPLIKKLESAGINRIAAVSFILLVLVVAVVFVVMAVLPGMLRESSDFLRELPENLVKALNMAEKIAAKAHITLDLSGKGTEELIRGQVSKLSADALAKATGAISGVFTNIFKWLLAILNILIIPLFFFFMMMDYEKVRDEIKSYIPVKYLPLAHEYMVRINRILSGYVRGKLVVALVLGLLYGIGLEVIGLKYGFLIGFGSGILSIIPYVGSLIGFAAAVVMGLAYYSGLGLLAGVVIVFTAAQLVESYIITPKLVGDSVGLSAFVIILSIIIGGNLMGVTGILLAIPAAAILKFILVDLKKEYQILMKEKNGRIRKKK